MRPLEDIHFPPELPVSERRDDIAEAIRDHQVVVVAGETGSGKTTQLPKICLALGRGTDGLIGHTQPRRIAARSVAERIAEELGVDLGAEVGYQVRFTDKTSETSRVKVMTDGILLAELQHDRDLRRYDTIIIDEAHERSLNIDFLLGYLRRLLPRRPDLKVVITSATIDPQRFADAFGGAPVIEVSGRTYPVEVRFRPLIEEAYDEDGEIVVRDQTEAIQAAVDELTRDTTGDLLVFLPGEREIRDAADALAERAADPRRGFEVLPLFSRLSAAEQHRVFARHSGRRVILSTNVAETSLTVPGITGVIDTGLARISRWSARTKVQRLPVEPISQASAKQRSGRCGRVEAGVAIRLYSEEDYEGRPEFTQPEILRTNLASVILQMTSLGLGDVARFPFLDPPDQRAVRDGIGLLEELAALAPGKGGRRRLTGIGRRLGRLPVDPRLGRMILEADRLGCLGDVLVLTAALSVQDPRERPVDQEARADQLHARFRDPTSDFLTWLNLWRYLQEKQREMGSSAFRRLCREELLNHLRVREWQDLERQLRQIARELGLKVPRPHGADEVDADGVHQALLSGLLSHIGLREVPKDGSRRRGEYVGARGTRFAIFPGSGLFRKPPEFVMAAELVETSRLWARQNAAIDPAWAERLGAHLIKRSWSEPHWSRKRAAAMAHEKVLLYGVPLVADRLVGIGRTQPELARELFIRHALVGAEWDRADPDRRGGHRFLADNRRLLEEAEELEHRARRRGIVVDDETLFDFYDARLPAHVASGADFDLWWKQERPAHPDLLTFDPAMLVREDAAELAEEFPDTWRQEAASLPLRYQFEPGSDVDGVTVDVPLATLNTVGAAPFSWQVPGLRAELVTALLRALPKQLRTSFVPVPDTARAFLADVTPGEEPLTDALGRYLRARTGVHVPEEAWDWSKVPAHLRPNFRVVDDAGAVVATGRDLDALKAPLLPAFEEAVARAADDSDLTATGRTSWTFGTIPESFSTTRAGHVVHGFPALVDEGRSVGLRVLGRAEDGAAQHRLGVRRLLVLSIDSPVPALLDGLDNARKLALAGSPYPDVRRLLEDCVLATAGEIVGQHDVREPASFQSLVDRARRELPALAMQVVDLVVRVLGDWRETDRLLHGRVELPMLPAMTDLRGQLARLVHDGFVAEAGTAALRNYPRYLAAMRRRVQRLPESPARDREQQDRVEALQQAWQHRVDALQPNQPPDERLIEVRWLLEELRVSLWAQQLGTPVPVSDVRIRKLLDRG
ncbi:ATP-dependent RNA helicase HrpA [Nocardioides terrisoli]|uniref:ATP-dependent RNA helicase HrpA n=1 Tax=Nocardioides terrisoli TaxID=3388267 RepID=UPI00287BBD07|nr:ATP-dependent RNA helicase HrpA [Nocardioides marmorisolisilvae]